LILTPDILEAAYNYLLATPPFCRWGLPDSDQLMFRVLGTRECFGHFRGRYRRSNRRNEYSEVAISAGMVKSTDLLLATMAHEMIHLYQDENGTARGNHNPEFRRLAKSVCAIHGFDFDSF